MKWLAVIIAVFVSSACGDSRDDCFPIEFNPGISVQSIEREGRSLSKDGHRMEFIVVNNPHCLTREDRIYIFVNHACSYSGRFLRSAELVIPWEIIEDGIVHIGLYLIRNGKVKDFQDKSVIFLTGEHRFLYVCFFPTNQPSDQIHFFPQYERVIQ